MSEQTVAYPYPVAEDEKVSKVMVYTSSLLCWGEVVTKDMIRVSTWLRTNAAPDYLTLFQARVLQVHQSSAQKPVLHKELHIPANQILSIHLIPPAQDPPDYDPKDCIRRLVPVTVLVGAFQMDGDLLIAQKSDINKFLEITKETYTSLYNVELTYPLATSAGKLKVPFLIFRLSEALISAVEQENPPADKSEADCN